MYLNFYDKLQIKISNDKSNLASFIKNKYKKYVCSSFAAADNMLSLEIVNEVAEKVFCFIGKTAAFSGSNFYILDNNGRKFSVDFCDFSLNTRFVIEEGFDCHLFDGIFDSIILIKLCFAGFIPMHSSCILLGDRGVLMPAWGGTGKTRMLLKLVEQGGVFISDEWTFLNEHKLFRFSNNLEILYYDLQEFPRCVKLSLIDRARLFLHRFNKKGFLWRCLKKTRVPFISKKYDITQVFSKAANGEKLHKLYFIQNSTADKIKKEKIRLEDVVEKILSSFLRENTLFFSYINMFKFANFKIEADLELLLKEKYQHLLLSELKNTELSLLTIPLNCKYSNVNFNGLDL